MGNILTLCILIQLTARYLFQALLRICDQRGEVVMLVGQAGVVSHEQSTSLRSSRQYISLDNY